MGLWCNQMGAGGWIAMIAFWAAALAVVIWVVGRMFPTQRTTAGRGPGPVCGPGCPAGVRGPRPRDLPDAACPVRPA